MINALPGNANGAPSIATAPCDIAPPPLLGAGPATAAHVQSPLQAPLPGAAAAAHAGAASITSLGAGPVPVGSFAGIVPVGVGSLGAPSALLPAGTVAPMPVTLPAVSHVTAAAAAPTVQPSAAVAAPQRMTTLAPGGSAADAELVERTLATLRQSSGGAQLVDRMLAVGARINVISDAEFTAMGHGDAHAFYDPKIDAMFLRRSDLADTARLPFAAVALAHEGTHLLDDVGRVAEPYIQQAAGRIHAAGGPTSAPGVAAQRQVLFELTMIKEARAFTFAGQVARDLGVRTSATDPTSIAAAGANDQATYAKVWNALLGSSYNPERRSAAVTNF